MSVVGWCAVLVTASVRVSISTAGLDAKQQFVLLGGKSCDFHYLVPKLWGSENV